MLEGWDKMVERRRRWRAGKEKKQEVGVSPQIRSEASTIGIFTTIETSLHSRVLPSFVMHPILVRALLVVFVDMLVI